MKRPIYLDHAAATPLNEQVFAAMQPYLTEKFFNPSATYLAAKEVRGKLEEARAGVAHWFGARPSEITFTAGGSEANNLAIRGIMEQHPSGNVVVSAIEHDSVLKTAQLYNHKIAPVKSDGVIDVDKLSALIDDNTVLVSVMYANNEVGTVQPIKEIAHVVAEKRAQRAALPLYFHTDACQAPLYLDLHAARLGVDLMTINGSKIYGPRQVGALYVKAGTLLRPLVYGGGQEHGLRSGTENTAGVVGLAVALEAAQQDRRDEGNRLRAIQQGVIGRIKQEVPSVVINGSIKLRLPNNLHFTIPGQDNERLMMALDEQGIQVAVGSACSASNEEPSHVLMAMGLSGAEAQASLRLTMGHSTTSDDMQVVINTLRTLL